MSQKNAIRKGCKDIWNAFMCEGADFTSHSKNDIPFCPTTATEIPKDIITWDEAKRLYRNALARKDKHFFCNAFICWFIDDYKFDGPRGAWHDCAFVLNVLRHFAGAITPAMRKCDLPRSFRLCPRSPPISTRPKRFELIIQTHNRANNFMFYFIIHCKILR